MICGKCGKEFPEGARFCPDCGQPTQEAPKASKGVPWIPVLAGVVLLLVIALVAVTMMGKKTSDLSTAQVPPSGPMANMAQAPVTSAPGQLAQGPKTPAPASQMNTGPSVPAKEPPKEVVDYLAKLQQLEAVRKKIANDGELASAMLRAAQGGSYDPNNDQNTPGKQVTSGYGSYISRLQMIATQVRGIQTPRSCLRLANSYLTAVQYDISLINELRNAIQTSDIGKALSLQQGAATQYTSALKTADDELDKLCKDTGAAKNFTISD